MFGIFGLNNAYHTTPLRLLHDIDEIDDNKNAINQKILDAILDDNDTEFSELISQITTEDPNPNQRFMMTKYKLPRILSARPTYASLCALFAAEKCFTTLSLLCPDGPSSENFKKTDYYYRSPIHFACIGGSLNIIRELFQAGFDLNARDAEKMMPCHYSALAGTTDVLKYIWSKGGEILHHDDLLMSPLHVSCLYGTLNVLKFICEKVDTKGDILSDEYRNCSRFSRVFYTPLHLACVNGNADVVRYILRNKEIAKKQVNAVDHETRTPLLISCQNGSLECVKCLVKFEGVRFYSIGKRYIALIEAAAGGYADIVTFLLHQKGVDVKEVNSKKLTALDVAILNGHVEVIEILIQNGAIENMDSNAIGNLFFQACGTLNDEVINYLDSKLDIPYETMGSKFMKQACKIESESLVTFLLKKNCSLKGIIDDDINFKMKWTPFMSFLRDKGADFSNLCTKEGIPVIVKVILTGSYCSLKELISEGVELNTEIIEKYGLLDSCFEQGKIEMIMYLMEFKPKIDQDRCLNHIVDKFIECSDKKYNKKCNDCLKIIEMLLNDYLANPSYVLNVTISSCCVNLLSLLVRYHVSFDSVLINFDLFQKKNFHSIFNFFKDNSIDITKILNQVNSRPIVLDAIMSKNPNMDLINEMNSVTSLKEVIEKNNLIENSLNCFNFNQFNFLLSFNPKIENATFCIKILLKNLNSANQESFDNCVKITESLLINFNVDLNDQFIIEFIVTKCLYEMIELFAKYGTDFNKVPLDYSKLTRSCHLKVFQILQKNGCLFQNQVKREMPVHNSSRMNIFTFFNHINDEIEKDSPIMANFLSFNRYEYDINTFLFLLQYSSNDDVANLRGRNFVKCNFCMSNVIDALLSVNSFTGILQVYHKLNHVLLPLNKSRDEFLEIVKTSKINELIEMVSDSM